MIDSSCWFSGLFTYWQKPSAVSILILFTFFASPSHFAAFICSCLSGGDHGVIAQEHDELAQGCAVVKCICLSRENR